MILYVIEHERLEVVGVQLHEVLRNQRPEALPCLLLRLLLRLLPLLSTMKETQTQKPFVLDNRKHV